MAVPVLPSSLALCSAWAEKLTAYSAERRVHLCEAEGSASPRPPAHPLLRPCKSQAAALISLQALYGIQELDKGQAKTRLVKDAICGHRNRP
ncbi:hypothetical protein MC885_018393 [Smutsia gigantea]|nr:hypothetical protein MC885_018393 [Smutsia gigantea]